MYRYLLYSSFFLFLLYFLLFGKRGYENYLLLLERKKSIQREIIALKKKQKELIERIKKEAPPKEFFLLKPNWYLVEFISPKKKKPHSSTTYLRISFFLFSLFLLGVSLLLGYKKKKQGRILLLIFIPSFSLSSLEEALEKKLLSPSYEERKRALSILLRKAEEDKEALYYLRKYFLVETHPELLKKILAFFERKKEDILLPYLFRFILKRKAPSLLSYAMKISYEISSGKTLSFLKKISSKPQYYRYPIYFLATSPPPGAISSLLSFIEEKNLLEKYAQEGKLWKSLLQILKENSSNLLPWKNPSPLGKILLQYLEKNPSLSSPLPLKKTPLSFQIAFFQKFFSSYLSSYPLSLLCSIDGFRILLYQQKEREKEKKTCMQHEKSPKVLLWMLLKGISLPPLSQKLSSYPWLYFYHSPTKESWRKLTPQEKKKVLLYFPHKISQDIKKELIKEYSSFPPYIRLQILCLLPSLKEKEKNPFLKKVAFFCPLEN